MDKAQTIMIIVALLLNISAVLFGYLNATGSGGLFHHSPCYLNEKYSQEIAPIDITFTIIWPIIYIWNFVAIVYIFVSMFLPEGKSPVNYKPTLIPKSFLLCYCVTYGSTIVWLFVFDMEMMHLSFVVMLLATLSAYMSVALSCKNVHDYLHSLETSSQALLWLIRVLIQNGLALLATWLTIATAINLGIIIIYKDSPNTEFARLTGTLSMEDASTLMLSILLALALVLFVWENFKWEKYCSTLFTTFPVLIFAFAGILIKLQPSPQGEPKPNFILSCIGVGICGSLFLTRIGLSIYRFVTHQDQKMKDIDRLKLLSQ